MGLLAMKYEQMNGLMLVARIRLRIRPRKPHLTTKQLRRFYRYFTGTVPHNLHDYPMIYWTPPLTGESYEIRGPFRR